MILSIPLFVATFSGIEISLCYYYIMIGIFSSIEILYVLFLCLYL